MTVLGVTCSLLCLLFSYSEGSVCVTCSNRDNGEENCSFTGPVAFDENSINPCAGSCYYRTVASDPKLIFRGCTDDLKPLPAVLPPDGCYNWEGATFCLCKTPLCNDKEIGTSSGLSLDYQEVVSPKGSPEPTTTRRESPKDTAGPTKAATYTTKAATYTTKAATYTTTAVSLTSPSAKAATTNPLTSTIATTRPTPPLIDANFNINCIDCRNFFNDRYFDWCPKNGSADISQVYSGECKGPCFTRSDAVDSKLVVRGCAATQGTLPTPLPAEGCYDWNGASFCVCYKSGCNIKALGKSNGVSLDAHLENTEPGQGPIGEPLQCYECMNFNVDGSFVYQCPKDGRVNSQTVYRGNCTGACFTRTFNDNSTKVGRGCTTSQYGIPYPLPPWGCYSWNHETWCICNASNCNGGPIGVSSGTELDAHLYQIDDNFQEPDGVMKCYQCLSYFNGVFYPQCQKNARVKNAFLAPCNGTCFTRTYDKDDRIVARGCSQTQYGLPKPLPPDGCYKWYTEVWCVCSKSRCNGAALGIAQDKEFDSHLFHDRDGAMAVTTNRNLFTLPLLALTWRLGRCFAV